MTPDIKYQLIYFAMGYSLLNRNMLLHQAACPAPAAELRSHRFVWALRLRDLPWHGLVLNIRFLQVRGSMKAVED